MRALLLFLVTPCIVAKLVYLQAMWRHGDRAPLHLPYPTDVYREEAWPRGWGQLTNVGMRQMYELGGYFRKTYDGFISQQWKESEVYVLSSPVDRALSSGQSMLAALYPPNHTQKFDSSLDWQPVPMHSVQEHDAVVYPIGIHCPVYHEMNKQRNSVNVTEIDKTYTDLFAFLANATNQTGFGFDDLNGIYDIYREIAHNLTDQQPDWIHKRWPQWNNQTTLEVIVPLRTQKMIDNFNWPEGAKLMGGVALSDWLSRVREVMDGTHAHKARLYSSHDGTLLALMYALGIGNDMMVPYASALIMEVHKEKEEYHVQFLYRNDTTVPPYPLSVPGCGSPCPASQLLSLKHIQEAMIKDTHTMIELCKVTSSTSTGYSMFSVLLILSALLY